MEFKDYYFIIGVPWDAPREEIGQAYREKSEFYDPARQTTENNKAYAQSRISQIDEAYRVIGDSLRRSEYDKSYKTHIKDVQNMRQARIFFRSINPAIVAKNVGTVLGKVFENVIGFALAPKEWIKVWEERARAEQEKARAEQAEAKTKTHWYKLRMTMLNGAIVLAEQAEAQARQVEAFAKQAEARVRQAKAETEVHWYRMQKMVIKAQMENELAWAQVGRTGVKTPGVKFNPAFSLQ